MTRKFLPGAVFSNTTELSAPWTGLTPSRGLGPEDAGPEGREPSPGSARTQSPGKWTGPPSLSLLPQHPQALGPRPSSGDLDLQEQCFSLRQPSRAPASRSHCFLPPLRRRTPAAATPGQGGAPVGASGPVPMEPLVPMQPPHPQGPDGTWETLWTALVLRGAVSV